MTETTETAERVDPDPAFALRLRGELLERQEQLSDEIAELEERLRERTSELSRVQKAAEALNEG